MEQNMNMGTSMNEEKKSTGALISIGIIVLLVAAGAYYFLRQVPMETDSVELTASEQRADAQISSLSTQGTSTELSDIQKDLDATDLSNLEAGLNDIAI